ncbi:MAG: hypothetical protein V2B20_17645 [Pseudomonadota bacterium]
MKQSLLTCLLEKCSNVLLTINVQIPAVTADIPITHIDKVRNQGFRKAVVQLYDHSCALCGTKMLTREGWLYRGRCRPYQTHGEQVTTTTLPMAWLSANSVTGHMMKD